MVIKAGKIRPSQAVMQFGPGALVDLPTMSMIIAGTDFWNTGNSPMFGDRRLAEKMGVKHFRTPPYLHEKNATGGMPAILFPEFLMCPIDSCRRLAEADRFKFEPTGSPRYMCDRAHKNLKRPPDVFPARFMVACQNGHLDDFPWREYVHPGTPCSADLRLDDSGLTGSITDLWIRCETHGKSKNLGQAMNRRARTSFPACSGRRPWLGSTPNETCVQEIHVLLRGASNAYFPVTDSVITVPPWSDPIQVAIENGGYVDRMAKIDSKDRLELWLDMSNEPELSVFTVDQIWDALELQRRPADGLTDLRVEEWHSFRASPSRYDPKSEFQIRREPVSDDLSKHIDKVVQALRLREVRALRGFTRIDQVPDIGQMLETRAIEARMSAISRTSDKEWLPGVVQRGEGVFIELAEERVAIWESSTAVKEFEQRHFAAQKEWSEARKLTGARVRPARYLLLHSLSHMIMRRFGLDCGYGPASLRERIYCTSDGSPMAGILIYTASADSQGSLGGLVEMSRTEMFHQIIVGALEDARVCASDPFCADREPSGIGTQLNGAACHACLLESETSCETGNNYLDRAVVVPTLANEQTAFFMD
jgi:hypothetical protein